MIKIIILSVLVVSSYANNYFFDIRYNTSLIQNKAEFHYKENNEDYFYEGESLEGAFYGMFMNLGYSTNLSRKMVFEPSFGFGSLSNSGRTNINKIYSIELPLLYQASYKKYGFFVKYNYLTDISMFGITEEIVLENNKAWSLGFKSIFENKYIDFILSYEYMFPGIYEQTIQMENEIITTKLDIEGSYISFGARFRF